MFKPCRLLLLALVLTGCACASPAATLTTQPTAHQTVPGSTSPSSTPTLIPSAAPTPRATSTVLPPAATPTPFVSFAQPLPPSEIVISADNAQVSLRARWGRGILNRALYSPDGRYLALATTIGVYVYDAQTLEELGFFEATSPVQKMAFSPDGVYLASAAESLVQVWRLDEGSLLYTLDGQSFGEPNAILRGLAFSPDSQVLALAWRSEAHLHRADDGTPINKLQSPQGTFGAITFAPSAEILLVSGEDKNQWVWRADACMLDPAQSESCLKRQQTLVGETSWTGIKAFSPDGSLLAVIASNGAVWVWRLSDGRKIQHLPGQGTITFSPDGSLLAYGSVNGPEGGLLRLWRVEDGELVFESSDFNGWVSSVSFSPDGATLATASRDGLVRLWRTDDWSPGKMVGWFPYRWVTGLALSPDESILAVASHDHYVRLWSMPNGDYLGRLEKHVGVNSLAFSPDGALLAASSTTGRINVWHMPNGTLRSTLRDSKYDAYSVSFSPDGVLLAAGGDEGQVPLWDVASDSHLRTLEEYRGDTYSVAFSPDGTLLATGHEHGRLQIWQVDSGELLHTFGLDSADIGDVAFSSDGELLAVAAGSNRAWLWQSSDWTPRRILTEHTGNVLRLAFSPDGNLLTTATDDNRLWLWRVTDGALLNEWYAHTSEITDLLFAPSGDMIISGSRDGSVRFWGLGEPVIAPEPTSTPTPAPPSAGAFYLVSGLPFSEVNHLWVAPDGQLWLATGSGVFIWQDEEWEQVYEGMANRILGLDADQRPWVLLDEGWHIGAYAGSGWSIYGPEQGWSHGNARQVLSDRRGWVWANTGQDLRYFDPVNTSWTTLSLSDVGFEPPPPEDLDQVFGITDMALDNAGNLWIGGCGRSGAVGFLSQGVRWFDGLAWNSSPDTAEECVNDIEVDAAGRVWMGGFYGLIMYDPAAQGWSEFPLPGWDRPQLVNQVELDPNGNPWVSFTRFGGAGPWHSDAVFYLQDGEWQAAFDPGIDMPIRFSFGPDGTAWILAGGGVYRPTADQPEPMGPPDFGKQLAIDGAGRVWVLGDHKGLWRLDPVSE
jgi:WD40 repeat protein